MTDTPSPSGRAAPARGRRAYDRRTYARRVAEVARVCRRMEGGESLAEICRDPTMPNRSTLMAWARRYPEFMSQLAEAREALPEDRRVYHRWSEAIAAEVLARIEAGRGLAEVCAEPDMPVHSTVTQWLRTRPDFAERYRQAREVQADRLFDLAWRIACEAREEDIRSSKLKIDTLKWRIGRLVPRRYGPWKAMAAEGEAGAGHGTPRLKVEVRRWAATPDRQMVEITEQVRGLDGAEIAALRRGIAEGRIPPPAQGSSIDDRHITPIKEE